LGQTESVPPEPPAAAPSLTAAPSPSNSDRWLLMKSLARHLVLALCSIRSRMQVTAGLRRPSPAAPQKTNKSCQFGFQLLANQFALQQNWLAL